MSNALKKQICYALGTLGGWGLARATSAKELVPFTILGGLAGFAVSETLYPEQAAQPVRVFAPVDKKGDGPLSGTKRRRKSTPKRRR